MLSKLKKEKITILFHQSIEGKIIKHREKVEWEGEEWKKLKASQHRQRKLRAGNDEAVK